MITDHKFNPCIYTPHQIAKGEKCLAPHGPDSCHQDGCGKPESEHAEKIDRREWRV